MKKRIKQALSYILITSMLLSSFAAVSAEGSNYDGTAAVWALAEIQKAEINGLTYPDILNNFTKPITREEFCILVVKLYGKLSGKTVTAGQNPFTDTDNQEIIKAYGLGIVKGTSVDKFSPFNKVTRQEMATLLVRTLKAVDPTLSADDVNISGFTDIGSIASWAKPSMVFCVNKGIFKGAGENLLIPLGNTDRQQAIILVGRVYESFKSGTTQTTLPVLDVSILPNIRAAEAGSNLTELEKFNLQDPRMSFSHPIYDTKLTLYAATVEGKPTLLPISQLGSESTRKLGISSIGSLSAQSNTTMISTLPPIIPPKLPPIIPQINTAPVLKYTNKPYAAFIDSSAEDKHYFAYTLQTSNAAKIVWQVSKYPFTGYVDGWKTPSGLISTGEVLSGAKEFSIEFNKVNITSSKFMKVSNEIKMERKIYFVRAVPIDSTGKCIGEPGIGLPVVFGKPQVHKSYLNSTIKPSLELWIAKFNGEPTSKGEFPNNFWYNPDITYGETSPSTAPRYFQLKNFDAAIKSFIVQVATTAYDSIPTTWENPFGLVYEKQYKADELPTVGTYSDIFNINLKDFCPSDPNLGDKGINYYIRVIGLKPVNTDEGGVVQPLFSNTRIYTYIKPTKTTFYETKNVNVPNYAPTLTLKNYTPIQFLHPKWIEFYEISKPASNVNDMSFTYKNGDGRYLLPYIYYKASISLPSNLLGWKDMSQSEYLSLVNSTLPVGSVIYFTKPEPKEQSWYEELWGLVSGFFSDIFKAFSMVLSYAANFYESVKVGIVSFVAKNFPLIPDGWRDALDDALMMLVDIGLIAVGLPPSLPNMDKLMEEGLDYAITIAAQEAGIPADQLTEMAKDELKEQIMNGVKENSNGVTAPNPVNSPILKTASDMLYRPAYMDFVLENKSTKKTSPNGSMKIIVEETKWPFTDMYEPMYVKIPQLMPGEKMPMRVYLKEYPFKAFINFTEYTYVDTGNRYWGKSGIKCSFTVSTQYNVPYKNALEAAKAEGLYKNDSQYIYNYFYTDMGNGASFEGIPADLKIIY